MFPELFPETATLQDVSKSFLPLESLDNRDLNSQATTELKASLNIGLNHNCEPKLTRLNHNFFFLDL